MSRKRLAQGVGESGAAQAGQLQVRQNNVKRIVREHVQGLFTTGRGHDIVPLEAENRQEQLRHDGIVINDEYVERE